LSSASFSSQDDASRLHTVKPAETNEIITNLGTGMCYIDFKRNKEVPFQKTINLVSNLIGELDIRVANLRKSK
jgi:hypothetical protein